MSSIVVICFFPAFRPPCSGGEMRLGSLYRALSSDHDVALLTSTDFGARFEEIVHTPRFRELRFPKDDLWRSAYQTLQQAGLEGDLAGLAFALAVGDPRCALRQRARELAQTADVIIHEFPFSEPIFSDGCPCREIYNSHNFEASLLSAIVSGDDGNRALCKLIRLEGNLVARAARVFATSKVDADKFRLFYGVDPGKLGICPNGSDPDELAPVWDLRHRPKPPGCPPKLLFIGSAHAPNVEAAEFLVRIASELPDCAIVLAGALCAKLGTRAVPGNVTLLGPLAPAAKLRLLSETDLFINPVVLGSGTSLKALEALGAGVPMISTPEGVRGLDVTGGVHCEVISRDEFVSAIRQLINDPSKREVLASAGLRLVQALYSWDVIARTLSSEIAQSEPLDSREYPPLVLALNDYSVAQPGAGGIARVRNLLSNLERDVVLVSFGAKCDIDLIAPQVLQVTVPKTAAHRAFQDVVNSGHQVSINDGVASLFASSNRVLTELVSAFAVRASAVIFEHPYMAPLLDSIDAVRPGLPMIYSSHNVEATHKAAILAVHPLGKAFATFIADLENRLAKRADLILCCTDADAAHFGRVRARIMVVPNGCELPGDEDLESAQDRFSPAAPLRIGFIGSGHGPNIEATEFILRELAPALPDALFEFIGGVCSAVNRPLPSNVLLHGVVSETAKTEIMARWSVGLNPAASGGGSSVKMADYMAHGLATLSTPIGARGFGVEGYQAGAVVDLPNFRSALSKMVETPADIARKCANARRYAIEKLGWASLVAAYQPYLRGLLAERPIRTVGKRLLVVTYRYTEPPLGGAEEYLIEILARLRPHFQKIDLAAVDVEMLTNAHHFGCGLSGTNRGGAGRLSEVFDTALFFAPDEVPEPQKSALARDLERAWTREERTLLAPFATYLGASNTLRVFGGFYSPDTRDGVIRRWTSPEFSFLLPRHARSFSIAGHAVSDNQLRMTLMHIQANGDAEEVARYSVAIAPHFDVTVALPVTGYDQLRILCCQVDEHHREGDHRPLGVHADSASVLLDPDGVLNGARGGISSLAVSTVDLAELHEETLRTEQFEAWVTALHDAARRRDSSTEAQFAAVRGPHSVALQTWLAISAQDYDCVLIQGIPFDVIPRTVESLARLEKRPRLVTLPHFHGDDRFYHWRRYYDSFAAADATLLFSSSLAERLASCGNVVVVPGGGVRSDEHGDPTADRRFREVHRAATPYFLVLGRKTPSKGYEQVIRAHQSLRQSGRPIDLVLIGPDEDGRKSEGAGVFYYGHQSRSVVLGALAGCLGLVTMSRSESFGIVLCEAWLFGKPVIANRSCYSFRELIQDGESGMLVSTDEELEAAMRYLADRPGERARMGRTGFEEVLAKYTWEKVAEGCLHALVPSESRPRQSVISPMTPRFAPVPA